MFCTSLSSFSSWFVRMELDSGCLSHGHLMDLFPDLSRDVSEPRSDVQRVQVALDIQHRLSEQGLGVYQGINDNYLLYNV